MRNAVIPRPPLFSDRRLLEGRNERSERGVRGPTGFCSAPRCSGKTTGRKPFCLDHVHLMAVAADVLAREAERDEEARVAVASEDGWRKIDLNGSRSKEILDYLAFSGPQSVKRLAMFVEVSPEAVEAYVRALAEARLVKRVTLGSRRGQPRHIVDLVERVP